MEKVRKKAREMLNDEKVRQFIRFAINGAVSSGIHYAIYCLLLLPGFFTAGAAYVSGYVVSFVYNYFFTCYFTFRTSPSLKRFAGFCASHALNFGLHVALFNFFLWLGLHPLVIPLLVIVLAMCVQFLVLRVVFRQ